MGRRKIEIKAIKDDRNRSVTFLKRKGGLFKKAHELSVLCSVDVAVIIFGHNKKLYEFSSGDINETIGRYQYYGGAHEHKGPEDFMGKKDGDDEDDDEEHMGGSPPRDSNTPPEHAMMSHHLQNQAAFQHMRHTTPSASPPMPNGGLPYVHRHPSPQPVGLSRPSSRAHIRRPSSNLAPPQHHPSQAPPPPNSYAYMPNPPFYNPQAAQNMPPKVSASPQPPQYQYTHPPPTHPQVQQFLQQEQRRQSMPPAFQQQQPQQPQQQQQQQPQQQQQQQQPQQQQQHAPQQPQQSQQPQQQQQQQQQQQPDRGQLHPTAAGGSPPQPEHSSFQSPPLPQPKPLPSAAKHSIFTPIDDSRSMLAAHWGSSSNSIDPPRSDAAIVKLDAAGRSQSIDVAAMSRSQVNGNSPPQPIPAQIPQPQRTQSTSSVPNVPLPSRTNSIQTDAKRPRLKVQIPSENSDAGSATADSSPKESGTTGATPARTSTEASHSSGVLLPPPSPSANSLLSAGATGPPNPFARPPPPANTGSYGSRSEMETPISALPSRFVENGLLPSPSSFYPEWGFGRDANMLPSPLNFQTPVAQNGPGFGRDEASDRKRKTPDEGSDGGGGPKRIKA